MTDSAEVDAQPASPPRSLQIAATVFAAIALVWLALAILIAVALPYGDFDAMSIGTWSRLIAEHWPTFHFAYAYLGDYQRPLFYFLQGTVWHFFGFHQALGRMLSLVFGVILLGAIAWLASRTAPQYRRLAAALAVVVLLLLTYFDQYIAAGLSDIPVAAMVSLTAAFAVMRRLGRARLWLVGVAAALSVLTKPSALPALVGLGAAVLIGSRSGLSQRGRTAAALAAGIGVGLLYDLSQARYLHISLMTFLTGGSSGGTASFYTLLAGKVRRQVLLDGSWLGQDLRLLLWFGVVYAILRLVDLSHRKSVAIALPVAAAWSWLGPHLAGASGLRVGILGTGGGTEQIAVLVLAASLLFALDAPADAVPDRLRLARLLVWAAPTLVSWAIGFVFEQRVLAPAWPPLILLITWTLLPVFAGARRRSEWLVAVPTGAVVALVAIAAYNINGLGPSGWRQVRSGGLSGFGNAALMRGVALGGDFAAEMDALTPQVGPKDRIVTFDGRLRFFYLDQVDIQAPQSCAQLPGHRVFVLLEDDEIRAIYGKHADSAFWETCRNVSPTKVAERPGAFAVFVNGTPRSATSGCGAPATSDQGLAIEFGRMRTAAPANVLQRHLAALGVVQAKVEQLGCSLYRVVETGVPNQAVGQSILAEAKSAKLQAKLVGH